MKPRSASDTQVNIVPILSIQSAGLSPSKESGLPEPAAPAKTVEQKGTYDPHEGFNLYYSGRKFGSDIKSDEVGFARFRSNFSAIGALAIRFPLGHLQRIALLEQIAREDYNLNPTDSLGEGRDQKNLFHVGADASYSRRNTRMLDKFIHYSLGRGKILNERTQRLKNSNSDNISGEQHLWEMMHSSIWSSGLNLSSQLTKQGFCYLSYPADMTQKQYAIVSQELTEGKFVIVQKDSFMSVKTESGCVLSSSPVAQLKIHLDPTYKVTKQDNGFVMEVNGVKASLGWIFHLARNKIVSASYTENLIRVCRIAQGGSHKMTPGESGLLFTGLHKNKNGLAAFSQNQSFNAMLTLYRYLEDEFKFDPSQLITAEGLKHLSYNRIQAAARESEMTDDFLTGLLLTEMVQPLKATLPHSTRRALPFRATYPFTVLQNNAKAIAYAFDVKAKTGEAVLKLDDEKVPVSLDPDLIDSQINGSLCNPSLNNPKHIASLLSAAMLVSEQIILEQLLRDACIHGDSHLNAKALKDILKNNARGNSETLYAELISMARMVPQNKVLGPVLGLQFSYCESIVESIRESLGFSHQRSFYERMFGANHKGLAEIIEDLYAADETTVAAKLAILRDDANFEKVLLNLFNVAKTMQNLPGTSVRDQHSRGVNAGLIPVIEKLAPSLYARLEKGGEIARALSLDNADVMPSSHYGMRRSLGITSEPVYGEQGAVCPFLTRMRNQSKTAAAPSVAQHAKVASVEVHSQASKKLSI
jgi:hypothetical protein